MSKILIVEDDEKLRNELKIFFENSGYEVNLLTNFEDSVNSILNSNSDASISRTPGRTNPIASTAATKAP